MSFHQASAGFHPQLFDWNWLCCQADGDLVVIHDGPPHTVDNTLDLTIGIPCLNEAKYIRATLDTVVAAMKELPYSYEIVVIDDGSTDSTAQIVNEYINAGQQLPIRLYRHNRTRGLAYSYVDGAFLGRGKYYRLVCGDNVEPKETLIAVIAQLGKADLIISYHESVPGKPGFRRFVSSFYTHLVNLLSGHRILYYNGLPVTLRYNVMRWGPYSFGFGFQAELITRLLDEGATYIQVPVIVTHQEKGGHNSALNWKNLLSVAHTLLEILIWRVRKHAFRK